MRLNEFDTLLRQHFVDAQEQVGFDLVGLVYVRCEHVGEDFQGERGGREPADAEGRMRVLEIQYRPEFARPPGALSNPTVRQALYYALDRATLVEVITHGLATVADSYGVLVHSMRAAIRQKDDADLTPVEWQFQYFAYREQITPSAHAALKSRRKDVLEPFFAQRQGRIFKVAGDGMLAEFGNATCLPFYCLAAADLLRSAAESRL